jgi:hypothetical protein
MPITPRGFFSLLIYFLLTPDPDWSGFAQVFELYNQSCHERKGLFNFWYSALPQAGDAKSVFISALNRSTQRLQAFGQLPGEILAAGSWRTGSQWSGGAIQDLQLRYSLVLCSMSMDGTHSTVHRHCVWSQYSVFHPHS